MRTGGKAGARNGDIIVELAGRKIENTYDYTYAIEALKIGQKCPLEFNAASSVLILKSLPALGSKSHRRGDNITLLSGDDHGKRFHHGVLLGDSTEEPLHVESVPI